MSLSLNTSPTVFHFSFHIVIVHCDRYRLRSVPVIVVKFTLRVHSPDDDLIMDRKLVCIFVVLVQQYALHGSSQLPSLAKEKTSPTTAA